MEIMPQQWFEMPEIKKRSYDKSIWIPLKEVGTLICEGKHGYLGFKEEYFGVDSIAVPLSQKSEAEKLKWGDIGSRMSSKGYFDENGEYVLVNVFKDYEGTITGERFVIEQWGNSGECSEWHLDQDLVISLGLKREGDVWVALSNGYEEVVKLERNEEGCVKNLIIRAAYLKDYLCARNMALYITSYRSRTQTVEDRNHINWSDSHIEKSKADTWEGRIWTIHEGGHQYGSGFSVMRVGRADVDFEEDVPEFAFPTDDKVKSKSWEGKFKGKKLYTIQGELWRTEWVNPGTISSIVRGDEEEPTAFFITDNSGKKETRKTLDKGGSRWLWFKPSVVNTILSMRGSFLGWYTRDTGNISCASQDGVHFGVNSIGYVNVYAKDIGLLPAWQQNIWAGYNVTPDGKVSAELLKSQMEAEPANTQAPEEFLRLGIKQLNQLTLNKFGIAVIKEFPDEEKMYSQVHRFRAIDDKGLFELAKDVYKLIGERIDTSGIKKVVHPKKEDNWGPLKSLERLLALKIDPKFAYGLLSSFWGLYTLRNADAHIAPKDLAEAYMLCHIDKTQPPIIQGLQLLNCCVTTLYTICDQLD